MVAELDEKLVRDFLDGHVLRRLFRAQNAAPREPRTRERLPHDRGYVRERERALLRKDSAASRDIDFAPFGAKLDGHLESDLSVRLLLHEPHYRRIRVSGGYGGEYGVRHVRACHARFTAARARCEAHRERHYTDDFCYVFEHWTVPRFPS